jgi:hypothetical protein
MKHFEYYPKIEYSNTLAVNIMVRGKIRDAILQKTALYYKYTLADGERYDVIADKYYGNSSYVWAIFYANNIIDPESDTHKAHNQFIAYIKSKYGSISSPNQNIHHYEYIDKDLNKKFIIDEKTYYSYLAETNPVKNVRIVSVFDYESELNDSRKTIVVLEKQYLSSIVNELYNLFN